MKNHHKFAGFIFVILFLVSFSSASAQVSFTFDEAEFLALNPGLQFQDFLGKVLTMPEVCSNPATSNSNDGCFSPGQILPGIEFAEDPGGGANALVLFNANFFANGNPPNVLAANLGGDSLDVIFTAPNINAVGLNAGCVDEGDQCLLGATLRVSVFGANGLLGSTVIPVTSAFDSFVGINTTEPITEVTVQDEDPDFILQGILNVWFGNTERNIPPLSEWGMIAAAAGLMVAGVLFAYRKRKANV
ncbi:MAG: hypothetical protein ACREOP_08645 [Thermodesulfobacteriota bacterium]